MNKLKALIVEDEIHARERLKQLLKEHSQIEIVAEASDGEEALSLISIHKPELIFLDIQLPILTGFEVLQKLDYSPKIIFTTAYEEFALHAFEHNSIDYLLKPFSADRLAKAIDKLKSLSTGVDLEQVETIMNQIRQKKQQNSITITQAGRVFIIPFDEIIFLKADQKCIEIHDTKGKRYLTYDSLQKLSEQLTDNFIQVHRAYIINRQYISAIKKGFRSQLIFEMSDPNGTLIGTGKTYIKAVKEELGI